MEKKSVTLLLDKHEHPKKPLGIKKSFATLKGSPISTTWFLFIHSQQPYLRTLPPNFRMFLLRLLTMEPMEKQHLQRGPNRWENSQLQGSITTSTSREAAISGGGGKGGGFCWDVVRWLFGVVDQGRNSRYPKISHQTAVFQVFFFRKKAAFGTGFAMFLESLKRYSANIDA